MGPDKKKNTRRNNRRLIKINGNINKKKYEKQEI